MTYDISSIQEQCVIQILNDSLQQHVGMTGLNVFVEIILPCDSVFTIGAFKFQAFVDRLYMSTYTSFIF